MTTDDFLLWKLGRCPNAEELALLREVYAETYPVRPLLNEIDRLNALIAWLTEPKPEWCPKVIHRQHYPGIECMGCGQVGLKEDDGERSYDPHR